MERYSIEDIREIFFQFFNEKKHTRIASASIVPVSDPSLLFVNSGMAPLKAYFLGEELPPAPDMYNVQPCVRTIDIEEVGDRHHLTFFEMLGSWSVDNYFKDRAIELAFELLTDRYGFPLDKLFVTVYEGDAKLGLSPDDVSAAAWERVGVPRDHIVWLGQDNFWTAGDTGPCGPCTEVFYDTGAEHGPEYVPGTEFDTASRYIEIWNAGVFMEFNRLADGTIEPLRFTSVDTGSGLERMAMVLQSSESAYATDGLAPIVAAVESMFAGTNADQRDMRIVTDHIRASTFMLSEGVVPSNEGRGYVPRRLLRKAIATATGAGIATFDLGQLTNVVIDNMKHHYPILEKHRSRTLELIAREQYDFGKVVHRGLDQLTKLATGPGFRITGDDAFSLVTTHGMPVDLIRDFAAERGGSVDEERFANRFAEHRELSRSIASTPGAATDSTRTAIDPAVIASLDLADTQFLGYQNLFASGRIVALLGNDGPVVELGEGERGVAVFDQTPFYAEGGGQIADTGEIVTPTGRARVTDTWRVQSHHLHSLTVTAGTMSCNATAELAVDQSRRRAIVRNHSATHLLHAALRKTLGDQVRQAGSLVAPDRLRFDFQYPKALSESEIDVVEHLVNTEVLENLDRTTDVKPYQEAILQGAIAFFGDKYDEDVRVVSFGDFSTELCGGTHVDNTAEIGLFRIVSESSIASGVRRIEALTGDKAISYTLGRDRILKGLASRLRVPVDDLSHRVEALMAKDGPRRRIHINADEFRPNVRVSTSGHRHVVVQDPVIDLVALPKEASRLSAALDAVVVVLLGDQKSGALRIGVSVPSSALSRAVDARAVLSDVLGVTGGRGGGSASFAQGGGPAQDDLHSAIAAIWNVLEK